MNYDEVIALLKAEVLPTMGCTEPGAVALAVAYASQALGQTFESIEVSVNSNIYKNGMAVGIPGTGATGLEIAAALGAIKQHPEKQLSVLSEVTPEELATAKAYLAKGSVTVSVDESKSSLWVAARVKTGEHWSEAVIKDKHTNLISLQKDGVYMFRQEATTPDVTVPAADYRMILRDDAVTIADLIEVIEKIPSQDLAFLLEGVDMNLDAAQIGIQKKLGMGIGAMLEEMVSTGVLADDIVNSAKILTAAAADARMSGENVRIMSSAGSGNHGITVILPVCAVAKKLGASQEQLVRAVALSHLVTIYIKIYTGNLSALCGCAVAAATGASAAITWLMGGTAHMVGDAIKNVIANLTGMICDGGKVGCALKLSTASAVAVESALLAQKQIVVPDTNGIIADTVEQTIKNLGEISNPGMLVTDKVIMEVMLKKEDHKSA